MIGQAGDGYVRPHALGHNVFGMARSYPFGATDHLRLDPAYAELRRDEPVARMEFPYGGEGWLVTGYKAVRSVLADSRLSRAATVGTDVPRMTSFPAQPGVIVTMDDPEHMRLRKAVAKAFTVKRVEELRPRAQQVTDELLDRFDNPAELVEGLAVPLPVTIICELLGVPYGDRADFREWTENLMSAAAPEKAARGVENLLGYITKLVEERAERPTDDLLGALAGTGELTRHEVVMLGWILLLAGHETTTNQIANAVATLLAHPDQLAALQADPTLLPAAVEELLRFIPLGAGAGFPRVATEDMTVAGVQVRKGESLLVSVASANRDDTEFAAPDRLDLRRDAGRHLAFGHGIHYCLGAQLARMELQVALGTLLRRFPGLRLSRPVEFKKDTLTRGPRELHVTW